MTAKVGMVESILALSMLHGSQFWVLKPTERRRMERFYMKCLRKVLELSGMNEIENGM